MNQNDDRKRRHRILFLANVAKMGDPKRAAQALGYPRIPPFLRDCEGYAEALAEYERRFGKYASKGNR